MRRHVGSVIFAGAMGLLASPAYAERDKNVDSTVTPAPVAVQRLYLREIGIRDEAAMVLVGTMLLGLAAAVRKAA